MRSEVLDRLRCPVCRQGMQDVNVGLRCPAGHHFDRARQGYVNLLPAGQADGQGDTAAMIAARAAVQAGGFFQPLADALAHQAADVAPKEVSMTEGLVTEGLVVEVGAGTAYYLAAVLDRLPTRAGLAIDLSKYAARRAAKAHPNATAIIADARGLFPLADAAAAVVLDVFAPRNGAELRRILRPDGVLIVVTPAPHHLAELREPLGLLKVDPEKDRRIEDSLGPHLTASPSRPLSWTATIDHPTAERLVAMGPSSHHLDAPTLVKRVAALPSAVTVTAAVTLTAWRPRQ